MYNKNYKNFHQSTLVTIFSYSFLVIPIHKSIPAEVCGSPNLPGQHWAIVGDVPPAQSLNISGEKHFLPGTNVRLPYFSLNIKWKSR